MTWTVHEELMCPSVDTAVIVADPGETPVTSPEPLTLATEGFEEVQIAPCSVALEGEYWVYNLFFSSTPTTMLSSVMEKEVRGTLGMYTALTGTPVERISHHAL